MDASWNQHSPPKDVRSPRRPSPPPTERADGPALHRWLGDGARQRPFATRSVLCTRRIMKKCIPCLLGAALLSLAAAGCGPAFTPEEARAECDRLRNDIPACFTDAVYTQCVTCHEDCGRECSLRDSCPHEFTCDE